METVRPKLYFISYETYIVSVENPMNILQDVCPISDFRENASSMVAKVRADNRPLIITQYGKSTAVLVSAESYQEMIDKIQILSDISESEDEIANGGGIEQDVFFKELMKKHKA